MNIIIEDINDNVPTFSQLSYQVSTCTTRLWVFRVHIYLLRTYNYVLFIQVNVDEGFEAWQPLLTVNATDLDSGLNAKIKYTLLLQDSEFHIDSNTGSKNITT